MNLFGEPDSETTDEPTDRARRRRRARRAVMASLTALLLLACLGVGALYGVSEHLAKRVERVPGVFTDLPASGRPPEAATTDASTTFLLIGADNGTEEHTTGSAASTPASAGSQRSDVIMIARLSADRRSAAVVSVPRDSWVDIPGHGKGKLNSAFAFGGPSLLVRTIEQLTGVRVDHFANVDFAGLRGIVDALGGVDVAIANDTATDTPQGPVRFTKGINHLDGHSALAYVRQRHGLPRGDLDRVERQQNLVRALVKKASSNDTYTNPRRAYDLLHAVTRMVSVDATLTNDELRTLAFALMSLDPNALTSLTVPVAGIGEEEGLSVVRLDTTRGAEFWKAFESGSVDRYLRAHPAETQPTTPQ
ncbi:LytR family transcriptional regulator [Saccharopolyspora aridisoli]|uniref:LytR family transcriptional regulator n=1 Tax=Saccharopolyspora aridisoli TaxID=2530385 RepID=A0A4R4V2J9_9PSEU|nr:LCP family protein [Saccharopolyspora aridisoli]TDC95513.1 LytR family transcriptional regulator [Saccharopolyspora aridisoli]